MKNKLKDNLTIKIVAVTFAIILWFYIQMVQNPDIEYTFKNIEIDFVNSAVLEENKFAVIDENEFFTDVTVKCQRWNLNELKQEDFAVYVDLSEIIQSGEVNLPVKVRLNNDKILVSDKSPSNITVKIDKIITTEKFLKINLVGKLKDGYYTNDKMVNSKTNVVTITGPKTLTETISAGVISVDLNNKSADFIEDYTIILVDSEGTAVTNEKVRLLNETATINASVYVKKIVPIEVLNLSEDLNYEIKPSNVEIAGPAGIIEGISKLTVNDFNQFETNVGYKKDIQITLPENVIMLTNVIPQLEIVE